MFTFISKIFNDGQELQDEIHSMCAVTLIMSILEHLGEGISGQINTINHFYLQELGRAQTNNYKNMIIQGIMMNFWYDQAETIKSLQALGQTDNVLSFILQNVSLMDKDFEIKRLVIGLSTILFSPNAHTLD